MMFVVVWYVSFSPPGRRNHTQFTDVCDVCVCRMSIQNSIGGLVGCVFFFVDPTKVFRSTIFISTYPYYMYSNGRNSINGLPLHDRNIGWTTQRSRSQHSIGEQTAIIVDMILFYFIHIDNITMGLWVMPVEFTHTKSQTLVHHLFNQEYFELMAFGELVCQTEDCT